MVNRADISAFKANSRLCLEHLQIPKARLLCLRRKTDKSKEADDALHQCNEAMCPRKVQEASYLKYEVALNKEGQLLSRGKGGRERMKVKIKSSLERRLHCLDRCFCCCCPADDYICRRSIQPNRQQPHFAAAVLLARQFRLVG